MEGRGRTGEERTFSSGVVAIVVVEASVDWLLAVAVGVAVVVLLFVCCCCCCCSPSNSFRSAVVYLQPKKRK
jgi:hypothetical protein